MSGNPFAAHTGLFDDLVGGLLAEAAAAVLDARERARLRSRRKVGATLRPGKATPLWNELRKTLRIATAKRGEQVKLARVLGLPRQRVNNYLTRGKQMPDAERTLLMLGWLAARARKQPMS